MDRVRIPAVRSGHLFDLPKSRLDILGQKPRRQPSVSKSGCPFHRSLGPPADPKGRMRFLIRLRTDFGIFEVYKLALIMRWLSRPDGSHRPDVIIRDFTAQLFIDSKNFVLPRLERRRRADAQ